MYSRVGPSLATVGFTDAVGVWREQRRGGMRKLLPNQKLARGRGALSDGGKGRLAGGGWFYCCGVRGVEMPCIEKADGSGNQARRGARFGKGKKCVYRLYGAGLSVKCGRRGSRWQVNSSREVHAKGFGLQACHRVCDPNGHRGGQST